jgi:UDP-N-acetylglucosamine 1-carboxyvinyltransferase
MNIHVEGKQVLSGVIHPSGAKNTAVALIPATILFREPVILDNMPESADVGRLVKILTKLGSRVTWEKETKRMIVDNSRLTLEAVTKEDLGSMRGTSLLWGPLLGRFRKIDFSQLPGGCTLGIRSLEPHFMAFRDLGVVVTQTPKGIKMNAAKASAREIWLTEMSPTVTENALFLAATLPGMTRIVGAASEPQVQDSCRFLQAAGVTIGGLGSNIVEITGGQLHAPHFRIPSDHYEVGTFLALGAVTAGEVTVTDVELNYQKPIDWQFSRLGIQLKYSDRAIPFPGVKR